MLSHFSCVWLCTTPRPVAHQAPQARILEWAAMPMGSSWPRDRTHVSYVFCIGKRVLYHSCHLREGDGNPLQCSCLENPRDGGALWAAVCGVAESDTNEATQQQQQQQHRLGSRYDFSSVQFSRSLMSNFDPTDCGTPGLPVHHQFPEITQTHVHWVSHHNLIDDNLKVRNSESIYNSLSCSWCEFRGLKYWHCFG